MREKISDWLHDVASRIYREPVAGRDFDPIPGQHWDRCSCKWCISPQPAPAVDADKLARWHEALSKTRYGRWILGL